MKKDSVQSRSMQVLINSLTDDEDLQQELWVAHLGGAHINKLYSIVQDSQIKFRPPNLTQLESIQHIISNPPQESFLSNFNDIEKSVMCLLTIGYNIDTIGALMGISEVSISCIIVDISMNKAWDIYGLKEKFYR